MEASCSRKRNVSSSVDGIQSPDKDIGTDGESQDINFHYDDTDACHVEISDLYSYMEVFTFEENAKAFREQMIYYGLEPVWQPMDLSVKTNVITLLRDLVEIPQRLERRKAARCILYIAQGCWNEVLSEEEQQYWARLNIMMLYEQGVFKVFMGWLDQEIKNCPAPESSMSSLGICYVDAQDMCIILSVLYTITEIMREEKVSKCEDYAELIQSFTTELEIAMEGEYLIVKLLGMVTQFCSGNAHHYPIKKILLLLWKVILITLGGTDTLRQLKAKYRETAGLPSMDEDTTEVLKTMRASSPPLRDIDYIEPPKPKKLIRPLSRIFLKKAYLYDTTDSTTVAPPKGIGFETGHVQGPSMSSLQRGLPWKSKSRATDLNQFIEASRNKFVDSVKPQNKENLEGLPQTIVEGAHTIEQHMYTSLGEMQIKQEEDIQRDPNAEIYEIFENVQAETLYQAMLPNLPNYITALLKCLLAASPTSKTKTDSMNIMVDVLPREMPKTSIEFKKLSVDIDRQKEIIMKAVTGILLLLLKHYKLNHIYQFEYISQYLIFANCAPLILKAFNQQMVSYVCAKNSAPALEFPSCVIGTQPILLPAHFEMAPLPYSWRNMFTFINLLRILNKIIKWKHSRIMMLVIFKSAPILKRALLVRHAMAQLYILKLLKMQTKYLGKQWKRANMTIFNAIYTKVRHRINDGWALEHDQDAKPWDFQGDECMLRKKIDQFNKRRYGLDSSD